MKFNLFLSFLLFGTYSQCEAPAGPWGSFNFAPASRLAYPKTVREVHGNVSDASNLLFNGSLTLSGDGSYVTLDFGLEVSVNLSDSIPSVHTRLMRVTRR